MWLDDLLPYLGIIGIFLAPTLLISIVIALIGKKRGQQLLFVLLAKLFTAPVSILAVWVTGVVLPFHFVFYVGGVMLILSVLAEWQIYRRSCAGFRRPFLFAAVTDLICCGIGVMVFFLTPVLFDN